MLQSIFMIAAIGFGVYLLYKRASLSVWAISFTLFSALILKYVEPGAITKLFLLASLTMLVFLNIKPLRRQLISQHLFKLISKSMPSMSSTEREALEAGTVSWEGEIFSGAPDFKTLRNSPTVQLSEEEQAFMDGPVNELCRMIDDWDITHNRTDMPEEVWAFIKEKGFLGMIIPKKYGGLEFSATAQMSILTKIYGRSITVATSISVPNSLGPAELLLKYGTEEQKSYYLPRLADGQEIPCFALTAPDAGSDAASIPDKGIVCRQEFNEEEVVGIKLSWNKRYITLCPIATVIGLAFRLYDPEHLLGNKVDIGISCALIPAHTPGVVKGRRHFPLNSAFLNGPTQGKDVFIPMDYLIGGAAMAGQGWRMLMECLSAGRAISLPSSALGGAQAAALTTGAYARVRKQFNQPIAKFEGIEEPLARIAGYTYLIDAALTMTAAAIDHGAKPSVAGAILKYHTTERARQIALDAMDVHGGKGICLGPNNYLGRGYQGAPISITVEGANILTRSLIIFGQGAIRCHPYIFKELESVRNHDLVSFDKTFFAHAGFVLSNLTKSIVFSITDARWSKTPASSVKRYYQLVHRYSANLAFLADFCMSVIGGDLKRKEKISARLGDMLSTLYLVSAVLKRFHEDHEPVSDLPLVQWCCQQMLYECEHAMSGVITNFNRKWAKIMLKVILLPFGRRRHKPEDKLGQKLAQIISEPNEVRNRLTRLVFKDSIENCPVGRLEAAFQLICSTVDLERKIIKAAKEGLLQTPSFLDQIKEARELDLISDEEADQLYKAEAARQQVIAVDDFASDELSRNVVKLATKSLEDNLLTEMV
ncbi:acyl-CoA dehydrogenase [Legionella israelensis]|uniref:Acyl-coenzyme A dehydrogenase n=1 Tax=Legionella israelensis TaxID=454 RepID=A0A0W0W335_9GAMM|nr:acyl-CoA dehydrogenase [Legionella israelensis]KTD26884.1 acyl-CoA dehydrogenase [Legionella israelensis]QBS08550.1 acyl-CoA dehydrogenase [Legionella israelensis]SCX76264.1 acyl-CoA dehydrogenase [Legionella israelensis DSM 19235]STX58202.1 oxidoreductase, acyl CoA dehydrogenase family [Legionella israelensis]